MYTWKVLNASETVEYIKADTSDNAIKQFKEIHGTSSMYSTQVEDKPVQAVIFSDEPNQRAYFIGCTKTEARQRAREYIKAWHLQASICSITTI